MSRLRCRTAVLLGCSALIAVTPVSLRAQDNDTAKTAGDATVLETITVEGTGSGDDAKTIVATKTTSGGKIAADILDTPASVSVITAKEIQQRGAQSVEEVLDYTAGVTTDFYGSDDRYDYFKIRGFDAYTSRDGLTLGNPFGATREEPYAFERVEVLKGANSTVFGVSNRADLSTTPPSGRKASGSARSTPRADRMVTPRPASTSVTTSLRTIPSRSA